MIPRAAPTFTIESFDPALPTRRFSITRVRPLTPPDQADAADVLIMRGELRAVMSAAHLGPDRRLLMRKNASFVERRGYRPLAVASASIIRCTRSAVAGSTAASLVTPPGRTGF